MLGSHTIGMEKVKKSTALFIYLRSGTWLAGWEEQMLKVCERKLTHLNGASEQDLSRTPFAFNRCLSNWNCKIYASIID